MTETADQQTSSSQFSIKRLLWTLIVASLIFKLADMTGITKVISGQWEFARGSNRYLLVMSIIVFALIAIVYIMWLGIRLPHLLEQYFEIRKKRQRRREKYRQEYESWRKE